MLLRWLRNRRRRALLAQPFPDAWRETLNANVRHYLPLSSAEQSRVHDYVRIFVAEKNWEGCGGQEMTDEVRVTIAGLVAIFMLGFPDEYFDHVLSILVYPNAYLAPGKTVTESGVILEGESARLGEAWYRGPVILSWSDVLAGARQERHGRNVVFHEFAHQLDMLNGRVTDGTPPMESAEQLQRWNHVMAESYKHLVDACRNGDETLFDCYGATNLSEFFAVATEYFFERPLPFRERRPQLYEVLLDFYRQDPARLHG
jgi:Mlc titration factor MtfA (ptsG expression regulator)